MQPDKNFGGKGGSEISLSWILLDDGHFLKTHRIQMRIRCIKQVFEFFTVHKLKL